MKCLFCQKAVCGFLGELGNKSGNCRLNSSIKLLVNYLLEIGSDRGPANVPLLERVLGLLEGTKDGLRLQLCDKCESLAASISELHLQLEVIQMKIIAMVQTLRNGVATSGNVGGRSARTQNSEEEEEVVKSFRTAVTEGRSPVQVPCVLLKKCFRLPVGSSPLPENVVENVEIKCEPDYSLEEPLASIDLKPELEENEEETFFVDSPFSLPTNSGDEDDDYEPPKKRKYKKRVDRKAKRNKSDRKLNRNVTTATRGERSKEKQPRKKSVHEKDGQSIPFKYTCDTCKSWSTPIFHTYRLHLEKHETGEKHFQCTACPGNVWLSGQQLYDLHQECHQGKHRAACEFCEERVDTFFLKEHMESCSKGPSPLKLFPCVNCSFCSSDRDKLLEHLRHHSGLRDAKLYKAPRFVCDICSQELPNRNFLLEHLFEAHKAIKKLNCPYPECEMSFLDKQKLNDHGELHSRRFECRHCKKVLSSGAALEIHELNHTGHRPVPCPECGEGFKTKLYLQRHLINIHNAPKFKCEVCGNEYTDLSTLKSHMRLHTGSTFPCDHCGIHFVTKTRLLLHVETHGTQKRFVCEECGMAFLTKSSLTSHRKRHSTEKRFKCDICDKAFRVNRYLVHHRRTHTGERPFVCDICGATFPRKGSLNFHKKGQH